jgi:hypothetical protein
MMIVLINVCTGGNLDGVATQKTTGTCGADPCTAAYHMWVFRGQYCNITLLRSLNAGTHSCADGIGEATFGSDDTWTSLTGSFPNNGTSFTASRASWGDTATVQLRSTIGSCDTSYTLASGLMQPIKLKNAAGKAGTVWSLWVLIAAAMYAVML